MTRYRDNVAAIQAAVADAEQGVREIERNGERVIHELSSLASSVPIPLPPWVEDAVHRELPAALHSLAAAALQLCDQGLVGLPRRGDV